MEYMATSVPFCWWSRVVPSNRSPWRRLFWKNTSQIASRPTLQCRHEPHGMMKAAATRHYTIHLVTEHSWTRKLYFLFYNVQICMTDPAGCNIDEYFCRLWWIKFERFRCDIWAYRPQYL